MLLGVAYSQRSTEGLRSREFKRHDFWRHSLAVATSSRMLADHALPLRTDELFLAGMLHDIGLLVLDRFLPVELDVSLGRAHRMELPLHEVERSIHGWDHAEIGALLIEIWGLAPILHDAVRYHHSPDDSADFLMETSVVALADSLAHQAGFRGGATHPPELDPALMDRLEIDETTLLIIEENMKDEVFEVESVLLAA